MSQNDRTPGCSRSARGRRGAGWTDGQGTGRRGPRRPRPPRRTGTAATPTHGAAVVGSDAELLAAALPFLDAGLRAGDLVALTCPPDTVALLCRELGEQAAAVESDPRMSLLGSRAPDALTMCSRYLERAVAGGSGRLRVVAEVDFGSDPADWREGQRFESVYNRLMVGAPVSAVCLYDRRRLPAPVIASAEATHPAARPRDGRGRPAPASRTPAPTSPPCRCPGSRSRTATRSSPSTTPRPWRACGISWAP